MVDKKMAKSQARSALVFGISPSYPGYFRQDSGLPSDKLKISSNISTNIIACTIVCCSYRADVCSALNVSHPFGWESYSDATKTPWNTLSRFYTFFSLTFIETVAKFKGMNTYLCLL